MSVRYRSMSLSLGLVVACVVWPARAASVAGVGAAELARRGAYSGGTHLAAAGARQRRLALRANLSLITPDQLRFDDVWLLECDPGLRGMLDAKALFGPDADELLPGAARDVGDPAACRRLTRVLPAFEPCPDLMLEPFEPIAAWDLDDMAAPAAPTGGGVLPISAGGAAQRPVLLAVLATLGLLALIGAGMVLRR